MEIEQDTGTINRRSAVKKAAVAGAIAWTTPLVISSTARAAAGTCVEVECKKYYVFKSENGVACVSYNDRSNHCPDTIHAVAGTGYVRQRCPDGVSGGYPGPITLPEGYHFVNAVAKDGSFTVQPAFPGQSPATEDEMCVPVGGSVRVGADCRETVQIPGKSDGGYSHVYVIVCAPDGPDSNDCGAYRADAYRSDEQPLLAQQTVTADDVDAEDASGKKQKQKQKKVKGESSTQTQQVSEPQPVSTEAAPPTTEGPAPTTEAPAPTTTAAPETTTTTTQPPTANQGSGATGTG